MGLKVNVGIQDPSFCIRMTLNTQGFRPPRISYLELTFKTNEFLVF